MLSKSLLPKPSAAKPAPVGRRAAAGARAGAAPSPPGAAPVSRRASLSLAAASAAALLTRPALAAYGEAANVFGTPTNDSGFTPFAGDGYALLLPAGWGPSKERAFPGTDISYEDNFFPVNQLQVMVTPSPKSRIEDFGTPDEFLNTLQPLLGKQAWTGSSRSEGGFAPNKVSVANVLSTGSESRGGRTYYQAEVLTRTADGNEGGRHHVFEATVAGGKLYMLKEQIGDKRWIRMTDKIAKTVAGSFTVA